MTGMKCCNGCHKTLRLSFFGVRTYDTGRIGAKAKCKACNLDYNRAAKERSRRRAGAVPVTDRSYTPDRNFLPMGSQVDRTVRLVGAL